MKTQVDYSKFNDIELKCLKALCDMGFAEAISVELVENDKAFVRRMEAAGFTMKFDEVVYRIIAMEGQAIEDRFYWIDPELEREACLFLNVDGHVVLAGPNIDVVDYGELSDFVCTLSAELYGIKCEKFNAYEDDILSGAAYIDFDVESLYPVEEDGGGSAA